MDAFLLNWQSFWREVVTFQRQQDKRSRLHLIGSEAPSVYQENGTAVVSTPASIAFRDIPERYRSGSISSRLVVLLSGKARYELEGRKICSLLEYSTKVCYLRPASQVDRGNLYVLDGYRYDMDMEADACHPICHAHRANCSGEFDRVEVSDAKITIHPQSKGGVWLQNIKIPTVQLDFFSAIIQILADHFVSSEVPSSTVRFLKFLREIRETGLPMPARTRFVGILEQFNRHGTPYNVDWYLHGHDSHASQ